MTDPNATPPPPPPSVPRKPPSVLLLFNSDNPEDARYFAELATTLRNECRVERVNIEDDFDRVVDALVLHRPTVVLNLVDDLEGDRFQRGLPISMVEFLGYPYVGAPPLSLATCQDRLRTHLMLRDAGLHVPRFVSIYDTNNIPDLSSLAVPIVVTQAFDDIYHDEELHAFDDRQQLESHVHELAKEYQPPLLVEEYLGDRRVSAIAIQGKDALNVLPLVGENDDGTPTQADLPDAMAAQIRALARRAFAVMDCHDWAQIDFCLVHDKPVITDVRPLPSLGAESIFSVAAGSEGAAALHIAAMIRAALHRIQPPPAPPSLPALPNPPETDAQPPMPPTNTEPTA